MTVDHPLRRALARLCSPTTMARIVDPVLADMRAEHGRASVGGCVALAKALALHSVTTVPARATAIWSDDEHAMPKAAAFLVATALVAALPLLAPPLWHVPRLRIMSPVALAMNLLPQAIALTLPASLLVAIPLALKRGQISGRLIRRTLLLATLVATANFVVIGNAIPNANQSFREAVLRALPGNADANVLRGPMELDFAALRRQIQDLEQTRGGQAAGRRLEYTYQLRLAIGAAAIPLGLAGLAVAVLQRARNRVLLGMGILVAYWTVMLYEERAVQILIESGGVLPEYLCAWTANLITLIAASAFLGVRHSAASIRQ